VLTVTVRNLTVLGTGPAAMTSVTPGSGCAWHAAARVRS